MCFLIFNFQSFRCSNCPFQQSSSRLNKTMMQGVPPQPPQPAAQVHKSGGSGGDRSSGINRWPRQETLALLKIRSDMDVAFRDSNYKCLLWDEVSRKLAEVGYDRSGKKCREKFENVLRYHKRTKDGLTCKSDGKTYRFFDQLEAIEATPVANVFGRKRRKRRKRKRKRKDVFGRMMKKVIDKQEEQNSNAAAAVAVPQRQPPPPPPQCSRPAPALPPVENGGEKMVSSRWPKAEINALISLRTAVDTKYASWEEISAAMKKLGHNRNAKRCKEKWENINKYYKKVKESSKRRPEDSKTCPYFNQLDAIYREKANNPETQMAPITAQPEPQRPIPAMVQVQQLSTTMDPLR